MSFRLGLNRKRAFVNLHDFVGSLSACPGRELSVSFKSAMPVGFGLMDDFGKSVVDIQIGAKGLSSSGALGYLPVSDLSFVQASVALFHEYGHYVQAYVEPSVDMAASEVSTYGNRGYYQQWWPRLPHEIDAEMWGVDMCWTVLSELYPEHADACMLEYIEHRVSETLYPLPKVAGGYRSRDAVFAAFGKALDDSLYAPRGVDRDILRRGDEFGRLLLQGADRRSFSPNEYHASALIERMPGEQRDRMLASLVLHLHPDLYADRPVLRTVDLSVEHVFGRSLAVDALPGRPSGDADKLRESRLRDLDLLVPRVGSEHLDDFELP